VPLSRPTINKTTYKAIFYYDDGDRKFDNNKDVPVKNLSGEVFLKEFYMSSDPN